MANNIDILGEEAAVRQIVENDFSATDGHLEDDKVTTLRAYALGYKSGLKTANFPNVTYLNARVFTNCSNMTECLVPKVTGLSSLAHQFNTCSKLTEIRMPLVTGDFPNSIFYNNTALTLADIGMVKSTTQSAFYNDSNLIAVILRRTSGVCSLGNTNNFNGTKYATNGAGGAYVYVPRALISTYQSATNWATLYAAHSDMFRPLEDYTVDGTTTGDFDESLI